MNTPRQTFALRPHDEALGWESNERRYFKYAQSQLVELEAKCKEVWAAWPVAPDQPVEDVHIRHPELAKLLDERNRLSDSVRIYSAMAVEGFLNWYGALRLGEAAFNEHFERLSLVPKLRAVLLVCDSVSIPRNDPLVEALNAVAQSRNALVHPKAREVSGPATPMRPFTKVPETARDSVARMRTFFAELVVAVPQTALLVPGSEDGA